MIWNIGTSGFSYKEWKGNFYPEGIAEKDMLSHYATSLSAVEINNTFYRMPKRTVIRSWFDATPESFRFAIKASRRITHFKRLKDTEEVMKFLIQNVGELGNKLGAVLFQLPPNMRIDLERLKKFLDLIPDSVPAALEFRHQSWFDESVFRVLNDHNVAICHADAADENLPFVSTANWGYLRLRQPAYTKAQLGQWISQAEVEGWCEAHVFFKHEDDGAGPAMALEYMDRCGVTTAGVQAANSG